VYGRQDSAGTYGHGDAAFAKRSSERIQSCGAGGEPPAAHPMQSGNGLKLERLDGYGPQSSAAVRLEQSPAVGAVGLVAEAIVADMLGRQE